MIVIFSKDKTKDLEKNPIYSIKRPLVYVIIIDAL